MRRPTMDDVAARAGVSRALVSLVMRDSPRVSPQRRAAVLTAARELGYSPHAMARQLAQRTSTVAAVLVSDLHNPYFAEIIDAVDAAARQAGFDTILGTGHRRVDDEERALRTLLSFRPGGLVLLSPVVGERALAEAARAAPVVAVERTADLPGVDTVNDDGRVGSALAVDHLVGLGHRDLVHLDGGAGARAEVRRDGFEAAVRGHGLRVRIEPSEHTEEAGARSVRRLLALGTPFTAVVAANDLNAVGALAALREAGREVPGDVSLVGYDNSSVAGLQHVGLTTVDQPRADIGRLAVAALLERVRGDREEPVHHVLQPSLVVRSTTAPPSGAADGG